MTHNQLTVIDAHCHIYPEKIAAKAVAGTDRFYGTVAAGAGTVDDLLLMGHAAGIDRYVVHSVATTPKQVESINEFIAAAVAEHPDRFIGLGALHPDCPDMAAEVQRIRRLGLRGVKLHPDIQDFPCDDPRCHTIYSLCEQEGLPILMHTGDKRYDNSNPNRLLPVLRAYPGLTVVGAHLGGYSVWEQAVELLAGMPNLYVDCSSCFWKLSPEEARQYIRAYGADRVLFGSDYPMWNVGRELAFLQDLDLTEEELRGILSLNAEKVFLGL
ncbi:MAG: amidohydrolase [Ruminococcaceae bacterium]|nr:amidohydrolase [Oscillospiraceae bacterium]